MLMIMNSDEHSSPDYNFILNNEPQKKGFFKGNKTKRIAIVVTGLLLLMVIFGLVFSFIFGSDSNSTAELTKLAARQTEIIRVAGIGEKQATDLPTRNYASAVQLSMISANKQTMDALGTRGIKLKSDQLGSAKDKDIDSTLTKATQNNRFNEEFKDWMQKNIKQYQFDIKNLYDSSSSKKDKLLLQKIYNQTFQLTNEAAIN